MKDGFCLWMTGCTLALLVTLMLIVRLAVEMW